MSLNLADDSISDEGISKLAASNIMTHLEELILYGNSDITSESLIMLANSQWTKNLKKIDLHATSIDDQGILLSYNRSMLLYAFSECLTTQIAQHLNELEANKR